MAWFETVKKELDSIAGPSDVDDKKNIVKNEFPRVEQNNAANTEIWNLDTLCTDKYTRTVTRRKAIELFRVFQRATCAERRDPAFIQNARVQLAMLRLYNNGVLMQKKRYPRTKWMFHLLCRFVALEFEALGPNPSPKNCGAEKLLHLLESVLSKYFDVDQEIRCKVFIVHIIVTAHRTYHIPQWYMDTLAGLALQGTIIQKQIDELYSRDDDVLCVNDMWFNDALKYFTERDDFGTDDEASDISAEDEPPSNNVEPTHRKNRRKECNKSPKKECEKNSDAGFVKNERTQSFKLTDRRSSTESSTEFDCASPNVKTNKTPNLNQKLSNLNPSDSNCNFNLSETNHNLKLSHSLKSKEANFDLQARKHVAQLNSKQVNSDLKLNSGLETDLRLKESNFDLKGTNTNQRSRTLNNPKLSNFNNKDSASSGIKNEIVKIDDCINIINSDSDCEVIVCEEVSIQGRLKQRNKNAPKKKRRRIKPIIVCDDDDDDDVIVVDDVPLNNLEISTTNVEAAAEVTNQISSTIDAEIRPCGEETVTSSKISSTEVNMLPGASLCRSPEQSHCNATNTNLPNATSPSVSTGESPNFTSAQSREPTTVMNITLTRSRESPILSRDKKHLALCSSRPQELTASTSSRHDTQIPTKCAEPTSQFPEVSSTISNDEAILPADADSDESCDQINNQHMVLNWLYAESGRDVYLGEYWKDLNMSQLLQRVPKKPSVAGSHNDHELNSETTRKLLDKEIKKVIYYSKKLSTYMKTSTDSFKSPEHFKPTAAEPQTFLNSDFIKKHFEAKRALLESFKAQIQEVMSKSRNDEGTGHQTENAEVVAQNSIQKIRNSEVATDEALPGSFEAQIEEYSIKTRNDEGIKHSAVEMEEVMPQIRTLECDGDETNCPIKNLELELTKPVDDMSEIQAMRRQTEHKEDVIKTLESERDNIESSAENESVLEENRTENKPLDIGTRLNHCKDNLPRTRNGLYEHNALSSKYIFQVSQNDEINVPCKDDTLLNKFPSKDDSSFNKIPDDFSKDNETDYMPSNSSPIDCFTDNSVPNETSLDLAKDSSTNVKLTKWNVPCEENPAGNSFSNPDADVNTTSNVASESYGEATCKEIVDSKPNECLDDSKCDARNENPEPSKDKPAMETFEYEASPTLAMSCENEANATETKSKNEERNKDHTVTSIDNIIEDSATITNELDSIANDTTLTVTSSTCNNDTITDYIDSKEEALISIVSDIEIANSAGDCKEFEISSPDNFQAVIESKQPEDPDAAFEECESSNVKPSCVVPENSQPAASSDTAVEECETAGIIEPLVSSDTAVEECETASVIQPPVSTDTAVEECETASVINPPVSSDTAVEECETASVINPPVSSDTAVEECETASVIEPPVSSDTAVEECVTACVIEPPVSSDNGVEECETTSVIEAPASSDTVTEECETASRPTENNDIVLDKSVNALQTAERDVAFEKCVHVSPELKETLKVEDCDASMQCESVSEGVEASGSHVESDATIEECVTVKTKQMGNFEVVPVDCEVSEQSLLGGIDAATTSQESGDSNAAFEVCATVNPIPMEASERVIENVELQQECVLKESIDAVNVSRNFDAVTEECVTPIQSKTSEDCEASAQHDSAPERIDAQNVPQPHVDADATFEECSIISTIQTETDEVAFNDRETSTQHESVPEAIAAIITSEPPVKTFAGYSFVNPDTCDVKPEHAAKHQFDAAVNNPNDSGVAIGECEIVESSIPREPCEDTPVQSEAENVTCPKIDVSKPLEDLQLQTFDECEAVSPSKESVVDPCKESVLSKPSGDSDKTTLKSVSMEETLLEESGNTERETINHSVVELEETVKSGDTIEEQLARVDEIQSNVSSNDLELTTNDEKNATDNPAFFTSTPFKKSSKVIPEFQLEDKLLEDSSDSCTVIESTENGAIIKDNIDEDAIKEDVIKSTEEAAIKEDVIKSTEEAAIKEDNMIQYSADDVIKEDNLIKSTEEAAIKEVNTIESSEECAPIENTMIKEDNIIKFTEEESIKEDIITSSEENAIKVDKMIKSTEEPDFKEDGMIETSEDPAIIDDIIISTEKDAINEVCSEENCTKKDNIIISTEENAINSDKVIKSTEEDDSEENKTKNGDGNIENTTIECNNEDVLEQPSKDEEISKIEESNDAPDIECYYEDIGSSFEEQVNDMRDEDAKCPILEKQEYNIGSENKNIEENVVIEKQETVNDKITENIFMDKIDAENKVEKGIEEIGIGKIIVDRIADENKVESTNTETVFAEEHLITQRVEGDIQQTIEAKNEEKLVAENEQTEETTKKNEAVSLQEAGNQELLIQKDTFDMKSLNGFLPSIDQIGKRENVTQHNVNVIKISPKRKARVMRKGRRKVKNSRTLEYKRITRSCSSNSGSFDDKAKEIVAQAVLRKTKGKLVNEETIENNKVIDKNQESEEKYVFQKIEENCDPSNTKALSIEERTLFSVMVIKNRHETASNFHNGEKPILSNLNVHEKESKVGDQGEKKTDVELFLVRKTKTGEDQKIIEIHDIQSQKNQTELIEKTSGDLNQTESNTDKEKALEDQQENVYKIVVQENEKVDPIKLIEGCEKLREAFSKDDEQINQAQSIEPNEEKVETIEQQNNDMFNRTCEEAELRNVSIQSNEKENALRDQLKKPVENKDEIPQTLNEEQNYVEEAINSKQAEEQHVEEITQTVSDSIKSVEETLPLQISTDLIQPRDEIQEITTKTFDEIEKPPMEIVINAEQIRGATKESIEIINKEQMEEHTEKVEDKGNEVQDISTKSCEHIEDKSINIELNNETSLSEEKMNVLLSDEVLMDNYINDKKVLHNHVELNLEDKICVKDIKEASVSDEVSVKINCSELNIPEVKDDGNELNSEVKVFPSNDKQEDDKLAGVLKDNSLLNEVIADCKAQVESKASETKDEKSLNLEDVAGKRPEISKDAEEKEPKKNSKDNEKLVKSDDKPHRKSKGDDDKNRRSKRASRSESLKEVELKDKLSKRDGSTDSRHKRKPVDDIDTSKMKKTKKEEEERRASSKNKIEKSKNEQRKERKDRKDDKGKVQKAEDDKGKMQKTEDDGVKVEKSVKEEERKDKKEEKDKKEGREKVKKETGDVKEKEKKVERETCKKEERVKDKKEERGREKVAEKDKKLDKEKAKPRETSKKEENDKAKKEEKDSVKKEKRDKDRKSDVEHKEDKLKIKKEEKDRDKRQDKAKSKRDEKGCKVTDDKEKSESKEKKLHKEQRAASRLSKEKEETSNADKSQKSSRSSSSKDRTDVKEDAKKTKSSSKDRKEDETAVNKKVSSRSSSSKEKVDIKDVEKNKDQKAVSRSSSSKDRLEAKEKMHTVKDVDTNKEGEHKEVRASSRSSSSSSKERTEIKGSSDSSRHSKDRDATDKRKSSKRDKSSSSERSSKSSKTKTAGQEESQAVTKSNEPEREHKRHSKERTKDEGEESKKQNSEAKRCKEEKKHTNDDPPKQSKTKKCNEAIIEKSNADESSKCKPLGVVRVTDGDRERKSSSERDVKKDKTNQEIKVPSKETKIDGNVGDTEVKPSLRENKSRTTQESKVSSKIPNQETKTSLKDRALTNGESLNLLLKEETTAEYSPKERKTKHAPKESKAIPKTSPKKRPADDEDASTENQLKETKTVIEELKNSIQVLRSSKRKANDTDSGNESNKNPLKILLRFDKEVNTATIVESTIREEDDEEPPVVKTKSTDYSVTARDSELSQDSTSNETSESLEEGEAYVKTSRESARTSGLRKRRAKGEVLEEGRKISTRSRKKNKVASEDEQVITKQSSIEIKGSDEIGTRRKDRKVAPHSENVLGVSINSVSENVSAVEYEKVDVGPINSTPINLVEMSSSAVSTSPARCEEGIKNSSTIDENAESVKHDNTNVCNMEIDPTCCQQNIIDTSLSNQNQNTIHSISSNNVNPSINHVDVKSPSISYVNSPSINQENERVSPSRSEDVINSSSTINENTGLINHENTNVCINQDNMVIDPSCNQGNVADTPLNNKRISIIHHNTNLGQTMENISIISSLGDMSLNLGQSLMNETITSNISNLHENINIAFSTINKNINDDENMTHENRNPSSVATECININHSISNPGIIDPSANVQSMNLVHLINKEIINKKDPSISDKIEKPDFNTLGVDSKPTPFNPDEKISNPTVQSNDDETAITISKTIEYLEQLQSESIGRKNSPKKTQNATVLLPPKASEAEVMDESITISYKKLVDEDGLNTSRGLIDGVNILKTNEGVPNLYQNQPGSEELYRMHQNNIKSDKSNELYQMHQSNVKSEKELYQIQQNHEGHQMFLNPSDDNLEKSLSEILPNISENSLQVISEAINTITNQQQLEVTAGVGNHLLVVGDVNRSYIPGVQHTELQVIGNNMDNLQFLRQINHMQVDHMRSPGEVDHVDHLQANRGVDYGTHLQPITKADNLDHLQVNKDAKACNKQTGKHGRKVHGRDRPKTFEEIMNSLRDSDKLTKSPKYDDGSVTIVKPDIVKQRDVEDALKKPNVIVEHIPQCYTNASTVSFDEIPKFPSFMASSDGKLTDWFSSTSEEKSSKVGFDGFSPRDVSMKGSSDAVISELNVISKSSERPLDLDEKTVTENPSAGHLPSIVDTPYQFFHWPNLDLADMEDDVPPITLSQESVMKRKEPFNSETITKVFLNSSGFEENVLKTPPADLDVNTAILDEVEDFKHIQVVEDTVPEELTAPVAVEDKKPAKKRNCKKTPPKSPEFIRSRINLRNSTKARVQDEHENEKKAIPTRRYGLTKVCPPKRKLTEDNEKKDSPPTIKIPDVMKPVKRRKFYDEDDPDSIPKPPPPTDQETSNLFDTVKNMDVNRLPIIYSQSAPGVSRIAHNNSSNVRMTNVSVKDTHNKIHTTPPNTIHEKTDKEMRRKPRQSQFIVPEEEKKTRQCQSSLPRLFDAPDCELRRVKNTRSHPHKSTSRTPKEIVQNKERQYNESDGYSNLGSRKRYRNK